MTFQERMSDVTARRAKKRLSGATRSRSPLAVIRYRARFRSAEDAADRLGCSMEHLRRVEGGVATASWELIAGMMALYDVSEDAIRTAIVHARREHLKQAMKNMAKKLEATDDLSF